MMKIDGTFLKHKVARQLLFLFLISALLPTSILAFYSLAEITNNTTENIESDLRQRSKKFGLYIFSHLELLDQQLQLHINELSTSDDSSIYRLSIGFNRIYQVDSSSDYALNLLDNAIDTDVKLPIPTQAQLSFLDQGHPVIVFEKATNLPVKTYLIRKATHTQDLIIGVVNNHSLWGDSNTFDDSRGFCIYGLEIEPLFCSQPTLKKPFSEVQSTWQHRTTGNTQWNTQDRGLYIGFWTLFLKPTFYYPKITIAISSDREHTLEPVSALRDTFLLISLLTLICIALLSMIQIRKYLAPLEALILGIARISKNDFDHPISVNSNDEFTQLADSFNAMSTKISQQFTFLTTLSEIDQLILSSTTVKDIINTTISLANTAVESEAVHIGMLSNTEVLMLDIYSEDLNHVHGTSIVSRSISQDDIDSLYGQKTVQFIRDGYNTVLPGYLPSYSDNCCYILVPILSKNNLVSILMFRYKSSLIDNETHQRLRELGDRFAIALEKSEWESQLYQKAHHDPLTELPNRQLLNDRLEQSIKHAARDQTSFSILFIDLDRFKTINDSLGHTAGDDLLIQVSDRLQQAVQDEDTVARLGGDEFIVLMASEHIEHENTSRTITVAQQILTAISSPFTITSNDIRQEVRISASIGIANYPNDGNHNNVLLKNADSAMYSAKAKGRNNFQFYSEDLNEEAMQALVMETDLHRAIENNEFELYYQPKVACDSGKILGAEALIRWNHPTEGLISPFHFIPIAEENGLINEIGKWTLEEACRQNKLWQDANFPKIKMSVNISPKQFQQQNLILYVSNTLKATQLPAEFLDLEIVESAAMYDINQTISTVEELKELGVSISIDDYGTGFSTLSYLKKFPVDFLKIDREFISNLENDLGDKAIVSSTILLAHQLGISIVAEGVENASQLEVLRGYDCDEIQGYYFSRPVPASEFEKVLANGVIEAS